MMSVTAPPGASLNYTKTTTTDLERVTQLGVSAAGGSTRGYTWTTPYSKVPRIEAM